MNADFVKVELPQKKLLQKYQTVRQRYYIKYLVYKISKSIEKSKNTVRDRTKSMNIGNMMKITGAWNTFKNNHPKFPAFCQAVSRKGIREGSIIEIAVTTPEGEKIETNLKVKESDLELLKQLSE